MKINQTTKFPSATTGVKNTSKKASTPEAESPTKDKVALDWSGHKPAHRGIKKMTRTVAAGVGAVGLGATAYKALTAATLGHGVVTAGIGLAVTAAALTAIDIGSGMAHHAGDNYFNPNLPHTQWHTEPTNAEYCMVGFSNKALDAIEFWPKWEYTINQATGKEPISWQVSDYKDYCQGKISSDELRQKQLESGQLKA